MTAAFLDTVSETSTESPPEVPQASWPARAGAFAVDMLPGAGVIVTMGLLALTSPADGWARWVFIGAAGVTFLAMAMNRLVLPDATGWTLGRALVGIAVVRPTGERAGAGRVAVRELAHLLDTLALFVGWLWPLWDKRHRTFADLLARTEVHRVERPQRNMRRLVAWILVAAGVLSAAGVGLGYGVVYRHERAVDRARAQIVAQGPHIVEQMLSYNVESLPQDFARAQQLTTDTYRPFLIDQQEVVKGPAVTTNEYWAVNSALLTDPPATTDHAAMLIAMQGQRGTNPDDLKFITASVRVDFVKSADDQWRVNNLTVLKKPLMNQAGQ